MKRAIALTTLSCFILSSVAKDVSFALAVQPDEIRQCKEVLDDFTLPPATGKVTGGKYYDSDRVVINIQDLHCNAEVQRNIARILKLLDDKYRLGKVYIEGAAGIIDTSWLCDIKDRKLKKEIVESLLEQGRLTGTEYYSITSGQPDVLTGLEDEGLYRENLQRLDTIFDRQAACKEVVSLMGEDLAEMKERYFSSGNRRFDTLISQYRAGKTDAGKYFQLLVRYAGKLNEEPNGNICAVELAHYQNITGYIDLVNAGRKLHYKSISRQLQGFTRELRQRLPYNVYQSLLTKTDNFTKLDELYIALARLSREYHLETERRYPQLGEFFEYIERTQHVNPLALLKEEKRLVEEIRTGLSRDAAEMEVAFLADFFTYFEDYLANRLTADDYEYFVSRFDDFKTLWARYAGNDRFSSLKDDLTLLDTFYRVNLERNNCFLRAITGQVELQPSLRQGHDDPDGMARAAQNAKEITVVVSGGFHTQGLEKLLDRQGITHYTITPGVTGDAAASDIIYTGLMRQQAKILSQALAPMTVSALEKLLAEGPLTDRNIRSAEVFLSMLLQAAAPVVLDREEMDGRLDRLFNGIAALKKFKYGIREGRGIVAWQLTLAADGKELQFDYLKDGRIRFGKISAKEDPLPKKKTLFNTLWAGTTAGIISGTTIAAAGFLLAGIWWLGLPAVFLFTFDALRNGVHITLAVHDGRIPEELNLIEELAPLKDLDQLPPEAGRTPGRYTLAVTYKDVIYINRRVLSRLSPNLQRRTFDHETWHLRLDRMKKRNAIAGALLRLSLLEETLVSVLEHFNAADNTGKAPLAPATPWRSGVLQEFLLKIRSLSGSGNVPEPVKTRADRALRKQQESADTMTGDPPRQRELLAKPTTIEPERLSRIRERINHLKIEAGATRFLLGNIRQSDSETIRAVEILTSDTNSFVFSSSFGNFLAGTYPFVSKIRMLHLLADLAEVKSRIWPYWSYWPWKGLTVSFWEQLSTAKIDDKTAQVIIMGTIEGNRADVTNITDALRILNSGKFNFIFSTSFSDFIKEPIGSSYKMDTLRLLMEVAKKKPDMGNDWDWTKFTIPFWRQLGTLQPGPEAARFIMDTLQKGERNTTNALEILIAEGFLSYGFLDYLAGPADDNTKTKMLLLLAKWIKERTSASRKIIIMAHPAFFWEWLSRQPEDERTPFPLEPRYAYEWLRMQPGKDRTKFSELPQYLRAWLDNRPQEKRILYPGESPDHPILPKEPERKLFHHNTGTDLKMPENRFGPGTHVILGELLLKAVRTVTGDDPLIVQTGSPTYLMPKNGTLTPDYDRVDDFDFRIHSRKRIYKDTEQQILTLFGDYLKAEGFTIEHTEELINEERLDHLWIAEKHGDKKYEIDIHIFSMDDLFGETAGNVANDADPFKLALYIPDDIFIGSDDTLSQLSDRLTEAGNDGILGTVTLKYKGIYAYVADDISYYSDRDFRNIKFLKRLYLLAVMRGKQKDFESLLDAYMQFEKEPAARSIDIDDIIVRTASDLMKKRHLNSQLDNSRKLDDKSRKDFDVLMDRALKELDPASGQLSVDLRDTINRHIASGSVTAQGTTSIDTRSDPGSAKASGSFQPASIIGKTILKHRKRFIDLMLTGKHTAATKKAAYENSVQQVFELLKPLSIAGITRKLQLQHAAAGHETDPAATENGAIYHITRTPADVTASILSGRKNGSTHIIMTPADQGDIGNKHPFMTINGQRIWRGQAGQNLQVFYLEQNRSFEQGATMMIKRLSDKTDTDLNYKPLAVVSDITTYKEFPHPLIDGAAYVINGNPELINWGDARGVDRVVENLYQIAGDEALAVYGEAIRQKQGENYIKGRELTLGINGDLIAAKGNRDRLLRLVKKTGASNLRLKGEPAAILKQDIAGLHTADAGFSLKVLGEYRIPEGADLSPALTENVVSLVRSSGQPDENRFDGLEIDARQWAGTAEQLTEWLAGVSSGRPDARFTLNLSGQMKQSSGKYLRENLPPSVKLINEPGEAPDAEGRYVKITVGKGFDLLRIMAEIERVNADSFEISFENEVLQGVLVEKIVKGLLERISEDSPDITYQLAFNTAELPDKTEADELARILLAIKLDVKGRDFREAAGRIEMGEMDWATEKIEHLFKQGSALYTSFMELTERYHSATHDPQIESAAANVVAFLKGIEDASLLKSYLDGHQRRGFDRDSDRTAFAGILWKFRQFMDSEIERRQVVLRGDYSKQIMSDAQTDPAKALNFINIMMIMGRMNGARELLRSIRSAMDHWSAQSLYRYIELAESAGITDLSAITAKASAAESKWDAMDKIYRYNAIGGDGEEIRRILNELAPQLKHMAKGNLVPYAKAYAKYGGFSYAETITMLERIRDVIGENADPDDPALLVANFQILDLLNNEKLKIDTKPRELRIDTKSIMAMLGAA